MTNKWANLREGIFTLNELASGTISPPPPLFGDFILDNTLTLIGAPTHSGKSLILAAMVISLDSGLPLFGKFPPNGPKRILAILQDAPTWDYAEQFRKLIRGYGLSPEQRHLLDSNLIINRGLDLCSPTFFPELRKWHEEVGFDVVVLDALWTFHSMNENDNSQMGAVMKRLKLIREEFDSAVIVTHHERKPSAEEGYVNPNARARGSTTIVNAVDFNIPLARMGNRINLSLPKARGGEDAAIAVDIVEVDHPEGTALKLVATDAGPSRMQIVLAFLAPQPRTRAEIEAHLKLDLPTLTTARLKKLTDNLLRRLHGDNKIIQVQHGTWAVR